MAYFLTISSQQQEKSLDSFLQKNILFLSFVCKYLLVGSVWVNILKLQKLLIYNLKWPSVCTMFNIGTFYLHLNKSLWEKYTCEERSMLKVKTYVFAALFRWRIALNLWSTILVLQWWQQGAIWVCSLDSPVSQWEWQFSKLSKNIWYK